MGRGQRRHEVGPAAAFELQQPSTPRLLDDAPTPLCSTRKRSHAPASLVALSLPSQRRRALCGQLSYHRSAVSTLESTTAIQPA